jgi:phage shock protein A
VKSRIVYLGLLLLSGALIPTKASAQSEASDQSVQRLRQQLDAMRKQMSQMESQLNVLENSKPTATAASSTSANAQEGAAAPPSLLF